MTRPTFALDVRLAAGSNTGDSTYWYGLLYGLARIQPNAEFLLFTNKKPANLIPDSPNFTWIELKGSSSRWWSFVQFPLAARKLKSDAIHSQYTLSPLTGKNGFTTIHDVSFFIGPEWFRSKDRLLLSSLVPASARRAKGIFAVSKTCREEIRQYIPGLGNKITVTYNACPPWIAKVDPTQSQEVLTDLQVDEPFLLTVGTRWPRKNMELAVEAVEGLSDRFPHRLVITGKSGWGDQANRTRSRSVGYVTNEQLSALYSKASLYLAPSRHEGFGIPLLEAFRCGCPVLCSTGGALPEVAGDAALLEPSWRSNDWTRAIESLLGDSSKLNLLRTNGFRREAEFTWEAMAKKTVEAYLGETSD